MGMNVIVTGGLGFIGSSFIRLVLAERPSWRVVNLDKQTYAGIPANLEGIGYPYEKPCAVKEAWSGPRYRWVKADICDSSVVDALMEKADLVVHFAAETHVDRSILGPGEFLRTNVDGTFTLLEAARRKKGIRFLHVGTDEVYGSVEKGHSKEGDPLEPRSPYSASKAASDLLALSYHATYGLNVSVTRASNNFGPCQFPEKALPLLITNALEGKPYPLYGDGKQVRDWLYVEDHARAVLAIVENGKAGEIYNVGGSRSMAYKDFVKKVLTFLGKPESLITPVADRAGHDRRYALNCSKLRALGWKPRRSFEQNLKATIEWYTSNPQWWGPLKNKGGYKDYYAKQYAGRTAASR
jgi:dTDP-glucose 4,6-dehydratase